MGTAMAMGTLGNGTELLAIGTDATQRDQIYVLNNVTGRFVHLEQLAGLEPVGPLPGCRRKRLL